MKPPLWPQPSELNHGWRPKAGEVNDMNSLGYVKFRSQVDREITETRPVFQYLRSLFESDILPYEVLAMCVVVAHGFANDASTLATSFAQSGNYVMFDYLASRSYWLDTLPVAEKAFKRKGGSWLISILLLAKKSLLQQVTRKTALSLSGQMSTLFVNHVQTHHAALADGIAQIALVYLLWSELPGWLRALSPYQLAQRPFDFVRPSGIRVSPVRAPRYTGEDDLPDVDSDDDIASDDEDAQAQRVGRQGFLAPLQIFSDRSGPVPIPEEYFSLFQILKSNEANSEQWCLFCGEWFGDDQNAAQVKAAHVANPRHVQNAQLLSAVFPKQSAGL